MIEVRTGDTGRHGRLGADGNAAATAPPGRSGAADSVNRMGIPTPPRQPSGGDATIPST